MGALYLKIFIITKKILLLKSQIDKGVITINANTDDVYNVVGVLYVPKNLEITFNVDSLK